ncbi:hypothetical protein JCM8547_002408 [Rhodosporidiobolus lusitaniae]
MEWADLVSTTRKTRGDVPPPLVGASVTLVNDVLYVFGGRPVASREMVNSLYALDLRSLTWTLLPSSPSTPSPRYFHSCTAWGDKLVFFGGQSFVIPCGSGEGGRGDGEQSGHLETLDELVLFDTKTQTWSTPSLSTASGVTRPSPRYAHLAVVNTVSSSPPPGFPSSAPLLSSRLVVLGGQNYENDYVPDLAVLNLDKTEWEASAPYPRKAGTYRSVGVSAAVSVKPKEERVGMDGMLAYSSYAVAPTEEQPEPVFVFSNTNFSNPRRDLDLISSVHDGLATPAYLSISDSMTGEPSFPPGLRFPHAYICGRHLVLSGAHVGINRAEFVVWALDLGEKGGSGAGQGGEKMKWQRVPVDKVLGTGSWGPSVGWKSTLVVLGDGKRSMMDDYNSRQTNFSSVSFVDLEGFGIYNPPPQGLPPSQQTLALMQLSGPQHSDYELLCSDKERLGCSRKILELRWPWFAEELAAIDAKASAAVEAREQRTATGSGAYDDYSDDEPIDTFARPKSPAPRQAQPTSSSSTRNPSRLFPITFRTLELPLSSSEVKVLIQYFHTLGLSTPLARSLSVLTALLGFTKTYETVLPELRTLLVHALHESLSSETAHKVYEAAVLGGVVPLQLRAMQLMLAARPTPSSSVPVSRQPSHEQLAPPSRYSDHSQTSSRLSSNSNNSSEGGLPYDRSSSSSTGGPLTPASSTFSSSAPHSPLPPCPPSLPPLPPIPSGYTSHLTSTPYSSPPLPSLPVSEGPPMYGGGAVTGVPPLGRSSSLSAPSSDGGYTPSTHSNLSSNSLPTPSAPSPSPVPSPLAQYPPPRTSAAASSSVPISSSTPARIAEAWREGEERDRRQRAEAARLAAEADLARSAQAGRKASLAPSALSSISERDGVSPSPYAQSHSSYGSTAPLGSNAAYAGYNATASVSGLTGFHPRGESDSGSVRSGSSSGGLSTSTKQSAEKAAAAAAQAATVTAKAVKKGFLGGILSQPTIHNAGTKGGAVATGPTPRKSYPAPVRRDQVKKK